MDVIFTDLDGTLLDRDTYAWEAAAPALERIARNGVPWVLVSSKTRAEMDFWRSQLGNRHPFVVENGGAAFIPTEYFDVAMHGAANRDSYDVIEWGTPYTQLVRCLRSAALVAGCRIQCFSEMSAETLAAVCDLPLEQAQLAKRREYDEAFRVLDRGRAEALRLAVGEQGLRMIRGGRFWHIMGGNDKALAVGALARWFAEVNGPVRTIGLGDGWNDVGFLHLMDIPVLIQSPSVSELQKAIPRGIVTDLPGPAGWNDAILKLVDAGCRRRPRLGMPCRSGIPVQSSSLPPFGGRVMGMRRAASNSARSYRCRAASAGEAGSCPSPITDVSRATVLLPA